MNVYEGITRDILRLFVWFPVRWLTGMLSISMSLFIFRLMGDAHFLIGGKRKRKVFQNMSSALGKDTGGYAGHVRRYFENHYIDRLHIFLYPKLEIYKSIESLVRIENIEALEGARSSGRGVLVVQPHFGPVQIMLLALALLDYKPVQIGYPSDKGLSAVGRSVAFRYRLKYEAMLPAPIVPADEYLGSVYKHLKKGGVVLTTGDGAGGGTFLGEHRQFKFLGTERMIPLGPAALALRTGAAFIPAFIIMEKYDKFRIVFEKPIEAAGGEIEKDKVYMTQKFLEVAERYITRYPYCWHFWDEIQNNQ